MKVIRLFITLLGLIPVSLYAQSSSSLSEQLQKAIRGKKAEVGIAVIIDQKDTITVNNHAHYPLMSVFKFHQAITATEDE